MPRPTAAIKETLQALGCTLNSSQWAAWEQALTHRLALIWGPPGTGKTATIRVLLAGLAVASAGGPRLRIAVAAGTYTAVDNVLQDLAIDLAKHWPDIKLRRLRSGARSAPAWLAPETDVPSDDFAAIKATIALLAGPNTTIVAGTADQLHRLITKAAGPAGPLFDVIIMDEAGQLDVAHALLVLAGAAPGANVIVAGDPLQLPPIHAAEAPTGLEPLVGSVYTFFRDWHGIDHNPLLINYRSNSEIVALGQRAGYPTELVAHNPALRIRYTPAGAAAAARATVPAGWPAELSYSETLPAIADPGRPVVCLTYPEGVSGQWNQFEADTVAALVWWYAHTLADGLDGRTKLSGTPLSIATAPLSTSELWTRAIGIVTPHRAQRARIVNRLARLFNADAKWIGSAVDTVERFQGQERDIIIASYAVGDPDTVAEEAEFLHDLNRFNVLATRAKAKLVVMASRELVAHISSDLHIIRSSAMLKDFVDTFCANSSPVVLSWNDDGTERPVQVEHRWH